ncbi:MAG TPA: ACP S-malonyltransferase [Gammaproteobacteria bacterium]|nr:ACP S-malonyltransferase [Gammaproteobacteria bacterium]
MASSSLVFPGQGSQSLGMLADISEEFSEVKATFREASEILGYDLWKLTQEGPAEELDKTTHTQPALLTASYAIWRILKTEKNIQPKILAGHSLGEYTALVCAGALKFTDAVKLVAARGHYMQEAVPAGKGALAAIVGLDDDAIQKICEEAALKEVLAPANFNSPGQVVIAGHIAAVLRAIDLAKEKGAKLAKQLSVSVPSHCVLMKPAAEKLGALLERMDIKPPVLPVINNVDVTIYDSSDNIKKGLTRQLFMPVRWVEIIQNFKNQGITQIIECGPGKVLSGLNKRIVSDMQLANTNDLANLQNLLGPVVN